MMMISARRIASGSGGRMLSIALFLSLLLTMTMMMGSVSGAKRSDRSKQNLEDLEYLEYPRRTEAEAAVLEWGHSAIISALDASVAYFGPQTSQAALLEVECMPVLASPLDGAMEEEAGEEEGESPKQIRPLDNADEVLGNMVVMTNTGKLSGLKMAKIAKASGAAALLVVNLDSDRPDDIYRLDAGDEDGADEIDIPVVMISMNSANVLTSATVTPNMAQEDIVNNGMPERVRLYAGGDRPFFEDILPADPTLYLIHNLLTDEECDDLISAAAPRVAPVKQDDILQMTLSADDYPAVERVMLWQGLLQSPGKKAIEERIEQVTGFPSSHFSDFIVDKLEPGAHWKPHFDVREGLIPPMASITIFLSENGAPLVYPMGKEPVKIVSHKGVAVVHHNINERSRLDQNTLHAILPATSGPVYVARKYVYQIPVSTARRLALPVFAAPFGGKLPGLIIHVHDALLEHLGTENGSFYFDKICVFIPMLFLLAIAQLIGSAVHQRMKETPKAASTKPKASSKKKKSAKSD